MSLLYPLCPSAILVDTVECESVARMRWIESQSKFRECGLGRGEDACRRHGIKFGRARNWVQTAMSYSGSRVLMDMDAW